MNDSTFIQLLKAIRLPTIDGSDLSNQTHAIRHIAQGLLIQLPQTDVDEMIKSIKEIYPDIVTHVTLYNASNTLSHPYMTGDERDWLATAMTCILSGWEVPTGCNNKDKENNVDEESDVDGFLGDSRICRW